VQGALDAALELVLVCAPMDSCSKLMTFLCLIACHALVYDAYTDPLRSLPLCDASV